MISKVLLSTFLAAANMQSVEIDASLHGYNLLWPSPRCCAFDLHVAPDGHAVVKTKINMGKRPKIWTSKFTLTPHQMLRIRDSVYEVGFFNLPDDICCGPMDGDERVITIAIGDRKHRVTFPDYVVSDQINDLRRVDKLWMEIKSLVHIPGDNIR